MLRPRVTARPASRRARRGSSGRAAILAVGAGLWAAAPLALASPAADLPPWQPQPDPSSAPPAASPEPPPAASPEPPLEPPPDPSPEPPLLVVPPAPPSEIPPPPIDPNDAPFMRAPNNQIQTHPPRTRPDLRRGWSARRRFAATLAPAFASLRMEFLGGRPERNHGAGLNLELDAQVWRWIWLRAHGTYSGHPVDEIRAQQPNNTVVQLVPAGTIHVSGVGFGPVFALDLGRFLPLIELGISGLRVATPRGGDLPGTRGEACTSANTCDTGLRCTAARVCEPTWMPEIYFGAAVDILIRRHLSFGAQFRYYAQLTKPTDFPRYLIGALRITVRF